MKKVLTLSYLINDERICLALKKRGFGKGNWNGYGGKLYSNEEILDGAVREIFEESNVVVKHTNLEKVAIVEFFFEDGEHLEVHAFFTYIWTGEPTETEEMSPKWYYFDKIPYDSMWDDDRHWLPRALSGEKLRGNVWFDHTGKCIKEMEWYSVEDF